MSIVVVRSPTRVDLAGGTLDLWPLHHFIGGATTVNVAIDIWTQAEITELPGSEVELISDDLKFQKKFSSLNSCLQDPDPVLNLLKVQLRYWKPQKGFRLQTRSESPVGGGLGGSSSLTISLLKAFNQFCQGQLSDVQALVKVAHNVEAEVLNTPTGTQDYFPAASGGLNILKYDYNGIQQKILSRQMDALKDHFMLVYTGKAHHSGLNNFEVMQRAVAKESQTMTALRDLKVIAKETAQAVSEGVWQDLPALFRREFSSRVKLAKAFTSPEIEKLSEASLQSGAKAVKICGAGGGGCVLVWVDPNTRQKVAESCQKAGFQVLDAKPVAALG